MFFRFQFIFRTSQSACANMEEEEHALRCAICIVDDEPDNLVMTDCGHHYHKDCIDSWVSKNGSGKICPECRAPYIFYIPGAVDSESFQTFAKCLVKLTPEEALAFVVMYMPQVGKADVGRAYRRIPRVIDGTEAYLMEGNTVRRGGAAQSKSWWQRLFFK